MKHQKSNGHASLTKYCLECFLDQTKRACRSDVLP
jgi:hypothetical protein